MASFRVVADVDLDTVKAGQNQAAKFVATSFGVWEMKLSTPLVTLKQGKIDVAISDRQGNVMRIERTFSMMPKSP